MSQLRARVQQATERALAAPSADGIGQAVDAAIAAQTEVPDLADSPNAADPGATVVAAWSRVMADVQWIGKRGRRDDAGGHYNFRGIDLVRNAVGPALRKHGVVVMPIKVEPEFTTINTSGGKVMNYCRATVTYAIFGPQGDRFPVDGAALGEAFDTGDKSGTKAQSVAERVFYITALAIPTDQPAMDPENGPQHELAAPKPPTAEEYAEWIQNKDTSFARLLTIKRELGAHPDVADATVTTLDGTSIKLGDLLVQVGRMRQGERG